MKERLCIRFHGQVQGVGFRPFIYGVMHQHAIGGTVCNTGEGVEVDIDYDPLMLPSLLKTILTSLPPLAHVTSHEVLPPQKSLGRTRFEIIHSHATPEIKAQITPDSAICEACERELFDPHNRRYHHSFINCTHCGPRYTITEKLPYDRPHTSMGIFQMCDACQCEYEDPLNRRYHAQPIACPHCGPTLSFHNAKGICTQHDEPLLYAIQALNEGKILAVKGLGGFHLICDATNPTSVAMLRERKQRPRKPFAVMFRDLDHLKEHTNPSAEECAWLSSKEKPIVLIPKQAQNTLAPNVAPNLKRLGAMLAYTPLHLLILEHFQKPIVATSANLSGEAMCCTLEEVAKKLQHVCDGILNHNRPILKPVLQITQKRLIWMRHGRGVAPSHFTLNSPFKMPILALGAHQKNSIALGFEHTLLLSPYIGDLNSPSTLALFEHTIHDLQRFYHIQPTHHYSDLHPYYHSTQWAKQQPQPLTQLQHHYAHTLAVMCEYHLTGPVLGIVWDGTGYGEDGAIWGGEVLYADTKGYKRAYHLRPFRLLGGEAAVKDPKRIALSLLLECFGDTLPNHPLIDAFTPHELNGKAL